MSFNLIIRNAARIGCTFLSNFIQANYLRTAPLSVISKIPQTTQIHKVGFHLSSPNNGLPPVLVLFVRYAAKAGAIITGRIIRKWWAKLAPEEKKKVLNHIKSRSSKIACGAVICVGGLYLFYIEHLVEDPITRRRKFMMLNQKQINQLADYEYYRQLDMYKPEIVPRYHPIHRRAARVVSNLIQSNKNLKEVANKEWSVTVIDKPEITNAFALPHGKIFVFTGMLNSCTNDDQLAVVLAHEIAHSVLSHIAESMSKLFFADFILLIPTFIFWTILPDVWAIFSDWVTGSLTKIFIHLPFSRAIEKEADFVGLQLAAKSCYDVREASLFWAKMKLIQNNYPVQWLSTHPSNDSRLFDIQNFLPQALAIREACNCPPLRTKYRY